MLNNILAIVIIFCLLGSAFFLFSFIIDLFEPFPNKKERDILNKK